MINNIFILLDRDVELDNQENNIELVLMLARYHKSLGVQGGSYRIYGDQNYFYIDKNDENIFKIDKKSGNFIGDFYFSPNLSKSNYSFNKGMIVAPRFSDFSSDNILNIEDYFSFRESTAHSEIGRRASHEDEHFSCEASINGKYIAMHGIFDGHAGSSVAKICRENLPKKLYDALKKTNLYNVEKIFHDVFLDFDKWLFHNHIKAAGSTAIIALFIDNLVYFANLGDSRAILISYNQGKCVYETKDQSPTDDEERARIDKAGSYVAFGRIGGTLAVPRAFGDPLYKISGIIDNNTQKGYMGGDAPVSPIPVVTSYTLDTKESYALVLCCDGITDVMTTDDITSFFLSTVSNNIAKDIVSEAYRLGSSDNLTVVVVEKI